MARARLLDACFAEGRIVSPGAVIGGGRAALAAATEGLLRVRADSARATHEGANRRAGRRCSGSARWSRTVTARSSSTAGRRRGRR